MIEPDDPELVSGDEVADSDALGEWAEAAQVERAVLLPGEE